MYYIVLVLSSAHVQAFAKVHIGMPARSLYICIRMYVCVDDVRTYVCTYVRTYMYLTVCTYIYMYE